MCILHYFIQILNNCIHNQTNISLISTNNTLFVLFNALFDTNNAIFDLQQYTNNPIIVKIAANIAIIVKLTAIIEMYNYCNICNYCII